MAGAIFTLKARDTRPIFEVALKNPDGTAHDLTGTTAWKLNIKVPAGTFTRDLVKQGLDVDGVLRYTWVATDWTDPIPLPLPASPYLREECYMEYEVSAGATPRMTFPNDGYDKLVIRGDLA